MLEPLQVRLLQHYSPASLKQGTKRFFPVAVSNIHPVLPITVQSLQLVLSNIPTTEGGAPGQPPLDIPYNHVSVTDKYKTSTLDLETFPVQIVSGDEYHFIVTLEPQPTSLTTSTPPTRASIHTGITAVNKKRVVHSLQAHFVITWSIPCSPGSIVSIHPLPIAFPAPHDLLVSFDSMFSFLSLDAFLIVLQANPQCEPTIYLTCASQ